MKELSTGGEIGLDNCNGLTSPDGVKLLRGKSWAAYRIGSRGEVGKRKWEEGFDKSLGRTFVARAEKKGYLNGKEGFFTFKRLRGI